MMWLGIQVHTSYADNMRMEGRVSICFYDSSLDRLIGYRTEICELLKNSILRKSNIFYKKLQGQ